MLMLIATLLFATVASGLRMPVKQAPQLVLTPTLPTLYVYDHCPFCVRVRIALGLKNIKFNTYFLANDDIATPTALVGKKISPIFAWDEGGIKAMQESLDIVQVPQNVYSCCSIALRFWATVLRPFTATATTTPQ
jgi:hypothetical protein